MAWHHIALHHVKPTNLRIRHRHAIDRADINNGSRMAPARFPFLVLTTFTTISTGRPGRAGLEQRQQELGEGEGALQVQREDAGPLLVGELGQGGAPGGAAVVDKDVQAGLAGAELGDEALALGEPEEVRGDSDAGAWPPRRQRGGCGLAGARVARGDVDFCAVCYEALGYHAAYAAGALGKVSLGLGLCGKWVCG